MVQSGNSVEVAVLGDDGAMAQGQRDGGDLDVDLRHRATGAAKLDEQAVELASGLGGVWPENQVTQLLQQPFLITVLRRLHRGLRQPRSPVAFRAAFIGDSAQALASVATVRFVTDVVRQEIAKAGPRPFRR